MLLTLRRSFHVLSPYNARLPLRESILLARRLLFAIGLLLGAAAPLRAQGNFGQQVGEFNGVIAYSNNTTDYFSGLLNSANGYTTGYKWQCVEFTTRYYWLHFGLKIEGGNANTWFSNGKGLPQVANGGTSPPAVGSILCSDSNTFGHVAIIREVGSNYVKVIQQNWSNSSDDNAHVFAMSVADGHYTINHTNGMHPYYWQGWLLPPDVAPSKANLLAPDWDERFQRTPSGRSVRLKAESNDGGEPDSWYFWIVDANDNPVWNSGWFSAARHAEVDSPALGSGTYWWSAKARRGGSEGPSGDGRPFHINTPPNRPTQIGPKDDQWVTSLNLRIEWTDPGDPDNSPNDHRDYQAIARKEDNSWSTGIGWGWTNTYWDAGLLNDGRYYWKVAAGDGWDDNGFTDELSFRVDSHPPDAPTLSPQADSDNHDIVHLNVTASDSYSGVNYTVIKADGQQIGTVNGTSGTVTWDTRALTGTSTVTLTAQSLDIAGNWGEAISLSYLVDHAPPTCTLTLSPANPNGPNGWYNVAPIASMSGQSASGIRRLQYKVGKAAWKTYTKPFQLTQTGEVTITYHAVANNGLTSDDQQMIVRIDSTAPPAPVIIDDGEFAMSSALLNFTVSNVDPDSGLTGFYVKVGVPGNPTKYRNSKLVKTSDPCITLQNMGIPNGETVIVTVRQINGAGALSDWATSDGITISPQAFPQQLTSSAFVSAAGPVSDATVGVEAALGELAAGAASGDTQLLWAGFLGTTIGQLMQAQSPLEDYDNADAWGLPVSVDLVDATSGLTIQTLKSSLSFFNGSYVVRVEAALPGTYTVRVKASHWLSESVSAVSFNKVVTRVTLNPMVNGDVNGDNRVSKADKDIVVALLGTRSTDPTWNPNADLDGDGVITTHDRDIVVKNSGKSGH